LPEVARFFGVVIRMYAEAGGVHHRPHIHAYYQGDEAVYTIDNVERLAGSLPRQHERLVLAWAQLHRVRLAENWRRLQEGRAPFKIDWRE
jgi:hypothetical protein